MLATARTFTLDGIAARPVRVEVDVHRGLPGFAIVGLPDTAVREARERVRAALVNCGFEFPLRRIVVNLAPASLRKAGPGMDLAIAAALLSASGQLEWEGLARVALAGELALDGSTRPVHGALAIAEAAREGGAEAIVLPAENGPRRRWRAGSTWSALDSLGQLPALVGGGVGPAAAASRCRCGSSRAPGAPDLADLRGQPHLRHALEVAAAGGHSLLMVGPPGAGKSLAASRLPSILPPLAAVEALEVARIASACGRLDAPARRPAVPRAPPHDQRRRPDRRRHRRRGRARRRWPTAACLFLDELCEFRRDALEALRAPLEAGEVSIARAGGRTQPALPVHAGRRRQPLSLRARRGRPGLHLRAGRGSALPGQAERRPRRPDRHPRRGAAAERGGDRRRAGRALGGGAGAGLRRPRAPGAPARARVAATPR